jgi:hypothetical protein
MDRVRRLRQLREQSAELLRLAQMTSQPVAAEFERQAREIEQRARDLERSAPSG